jgi:hypothetical protein
MCNAHGYKVKLRENCDPKDLRDDYVRLSDGCMKSLKTDFAWFLHPDMWVANPEKILQVADSDEVAMFTRVRSFAGEPGWKIYELKGRGEAWKNIYRLRNPDMGAHYWGHYGNGHEDVYFSDITGDAHIHHGSNFHRYPYTVADSGLNVLHFSDVRTPERRYDRMVKCLLNQGHSEADATRLAGGHPRVTLKDGNGFEFVEAQYPQEMLDINRSYEHMRMGAACSA